MAPSPNINDPIMDIVLDPYLTINLPVNGRVITPVMAMDPIINPNCQGCPPLCIM